jgi:hypothetical protein
MEREKNSERGRAVRENFFDPISDDGRRLNPRIGNLILAQLETIAPASLPLETLRHGVACGYPEVVDGDIVRAMDNLLANALVIRIGEGGFPDRFRLADGDFCTTAEVEC